MCKIFKKIDMTYVKILTMQIETWFPTQVGFTQVPFDCLEVTKQKVDAWLTDNPDAIKPNDVESVKTTYHGPRTFLEDANLLELREQIMMNVSKYMLMMGWKPKGNFALESWINLFEPNAVEQEHAHYSALLCGCFYLTAPEGSGRFVIKDPIDTRRQWLEGSNLPETEHTFPAVQYDPLPGRMLVFQPWMKHSVSRNTGTETRISIAFNVVSK